LALRRQNRHLYVLNARGRCILGRMSFSELAAQLTEIGRQYHTLGWVDGTSGNFSAVTSREPLRLAITSSGVDKRVLSPGDIVEIDEHGSVLAGSGQPSAETSLHLALVRARGAGAVLHTHSIWSTILSDIPDDGLAIQGYEMLKGLDGVSTHDHREWVPIVANTQDWVAATPDIESMLNRQANAHGFLIRRHGLYTWGRDVAQARRHVEIFEFLIEVIARKRGMTWQT
jgi:methylthioribulose-1-phosphate dehydratase